MNVNAKAIELGAVETESGINWTWAFFMDEASARAFVEWLDSQGIDNRGAYAPYTHDSRWGVRYR